MPPDAQLNIKRPNRITREKLHRQVWEIPISRLAEIYGISGRGLAKICERLKVRVPARGYWARKAAGQKVVQYRLEPPDADTPEYIDIRPTPVEAPPPEPSPEVKEAVAQATRAVGGADVPERLLRPHPAIAAWLATHDEQRARARREPWMKHWAPDPWSPLDRRRHRLWDTIFKRTAAAGFIVKKALIHEAELELSGERLVCRLRERQRQVREPAKSGDYDYARRGWTQRMQPTGILWFSIKTHLLGRGQRQWQDAEGRSLETQMAEILVALAPLGPLMLEAKRQRQDAERVRREEETRRYQEAER